MVKNIGGNKTKKQARKVVQSNTNQSTRKANEKDELYGITTKIFGNGRAEVKCIDNIKRIMIIRKKFKGRNKRDNTVSLNTWVLVGIRSWEVRKAEEKENCDLLEVYSNNDIDYLKENEDRPWNILKAGLGTNLDDNTALEDSNVKFTDEATQKYEDLLSTLDKTPENVKEKLDWLNNDSDSDFDIDDL